MTYKQVLRAALLCSALSLLTLAAAAQVAKRNRYVGLHELGVNRVSFKRRIGSVVMSERPEGLYLEGEGRQDPHFLRIAGTVTRIDDKLLELDGEISGVPDMSWRDEAPRERSTRGKFTFRVTKGRKFWRLYEVNGTDCVCDDGCGNDFCYIDIDLQTRTPAPAQSKARP